MPVALYMLWHAFVIWAHNLCAGICLTACNWCSGLLCTKNWWHFGSWVSVVFALHLFDTWAECVCLPWFLLSVRGLNMCSVFDTLLWSWVVSFWVTHWPHEHTHTYTHTHRDKQVVAFQHESQLWAEVESFLVWAIPPRWHFWYFFWWIWVSGHGPTYSWTADLTHAF